MEEEESQTQQLQNKVDKLKLLNLAQNIHNLNPPQQIQEDASRDIALVNALSSHPRIQRKVLEIRGLEWNQKKKIFEQIAEPRMNVNGAKLMADILTTIAEETEWASYSEEEIPSRIVHYYEENIPYILFYHEDYELHPKYFGYIINMLQVFIDASFHKAKSGKYINTLGRTYDEGTLRRALDTTGSSQPTKRQEGFLSKYNPFRDR